MHKHVPVKIYLTEQDLDPRFAKCAAERFVAFGEFEAHNSFDCTIADHNIATHDKPFA
jgi:hypothetical protein